MTGRLHGAWGGPGGIAASLEDIGRFGASVGGLGADARADADRIAVLTFRAVSESRFADPVTAGLADDALVHLTASAARVSAELVGLGRDLQTALSRYERTEAETAQSMRRLDTVSGYAAGCLAPAAAAAAGVGSAAALSHPELLGPLGEALAQLAAAIPRRLTEHPELAGHLVNALPGGLAGTTCTLPAAGPSVLAGLLSTPVSTVPLLATGAARLYTRGRFAVHEAAPPVPVTPPSSVADLARLLLPGGAPRPPGAVDVHAVRVRLPDGGLCVTYLVVIPGTEDWSPPGRPRTDSARDLAANLQLSAGQRTELTRSLPTLLDRAGVPAGASVVMVGHSQGGMVALQAAGDAALRRRVRITDVVTFGSPLGAIRLPRDVDVLSVENLRDVVPRLDGEPRNTDTPRHLTMTFDLDEAPGADPIGFQHSMDSYLRGAELFDREAAAGNPLLLAVLGGMRRRLTVAARRDEREPSPEVRSRRFVVRLDQHAADEAPRPAGPNPTGVRGHGQGSR